ncbi:MULTISPECIES: hypothetical protein [unclassified Polaromonas]|uniref:hypothetical protein n=1 Tax=unclassified Polaromonas TaxID=2638319 RepID=UPI00129E55A5|nr:MULTISPECIES: hypothetical protein [unclassified Polaromonas]QGJ17680.1 hypothetical protein F7R28_04240 [Polaromonas sp. Pch-P]
MADQSSVRSLSTELLDVLHKHQFCSLGAVAQVELAVLLERLGFSVRLEMRVPGYHRINNDETQGKGGGRIDLMAAGKGQLIGVEIDSWSMPKLKSIRKLIAFKQLTHRVVLLNHKPGLLGRQTYLPATVQNLSDSLDLVMHLDVYQPADKTLAIGNARSIRERFPSGSIGRRRIRP